MTKMRKVSGLRFKQIIRLPPNEDRGEAWGGEVLLGLCDDGRVWLVTPEDLIHSTGGWEEQADTGMGVDY